MLEEEVKNKLISKFPFLGDKVVVQRARRMWITVGMDEFWRVLDHVIKTLNYNMLIAITGTDEGDKFGLIYHMAQSGGPMMMIKTSIPKSDPVLQTITKYFPSAEIYEREMVDLLGIKVTGLSEGNRYPLPDEWPANVYPLRKDFNSAILDEKEGCK
jgi:Ni,Fe-hydrogenase III component G